MNSGRSVLKPERGILAAFAALVFLIAANVVAIRFLSQEMPPFWAAGSRFVAAALLFWGYSLLRRLPVPRGRALVGVLIFGILQFGVGFAMGYWALQQVPAGLGSVILASIPLFTLVFAFIARQEPIRIRGVVGSLIAIGGIAIMFGERAGKDIPIGYLLAVVGTAATFALVPVLLKSFPTVHLAMTNAIGMITGAVILLAFSLVNQEDWVTPRELETWIAYLYLVLPGSVGVFALFLFVLKRWTASALSYQTVLSPIVSIALSAWLLGEPITSGLFAGSIFVIAGVYVGALAPEKQVQPKKQAQ